MAQYIPRQSDLTEPGLIFKSYFFQAVDPTKKIQEKMARFKQIVKESDDVVFSFIVDSKRERKKVKLPTTSIDDLLDNYGIRSTYILRERNCFAYLDGEQIIGIRFPNMNTINRGRKEIEILTPDYDPQKPITKVSAKFNDIEEYLPDNIENISTTSNFNKDIANERPLYESLRLINRFHWSPLNPNYNGPTNHFEISGEARKKWSQGFGRPIYRSGLFNEPLQMLIQNDKVVGFLYGKNSTKTFRHGNNYQEVDVNQKRKEEFDLVWGKYKLNIPQHSKEIIAQALKKNKFDLTFKSEIIELLEKSTEFTVISEQKGLVKKIVFTENSPLSSIIIRGQDLHDFSLNPRWEIRELERQRLEERANRNNG